MSSIKLLEAAENTAISYMPADQVQPTALKP